MNSLSVIKPHACHLCNKEFARKYTLHRHMENMHAEEQSTDGEENTETEYSSGSEHEPLHKKRRCMSPEHSDESSGEDDSESEPEDESADDDDEEDEQSSGDESSGDESSSELEDNTAYQDWLEEAKEATEEMRNAKYEKYVNEGMAELQAKEKAKWKTKWAVKRIFFNNYKDFLSSYLHLKDNDTHQDIVEDLEERLNKDKDVNKALLG